MMYETARVGRMLTSKTTTISTPDAFVCESPAMFQVRELIRRTTDSNAPVLLYGEPGVGKSRIARELHWLRSRTSRGFFEIHCEGIAAERSPCDFRSELEQLPHDATVFFKDLPALPRWAQVQLADILGRRISHGTKMFRLICSSLLGPGDLVEQNIVIRELYHLAGVVRVNVHPLRERERDLLPLFSLFSSRAGAARSLSEIETEQLLSRSWPGNCHDLKVVARLFAVVSRSGGDNQECPSLFSSPKLNCGTNPATIRVDPTTGLKNMLNKVVAEVVHHHKGNKSQAARSLQIPRKKLYRIQDYAMKPSGDCETPIETRDQSLDRS